VADSSVLKKGIYDVGWKCTEVRQYEDAQRCAMWNERME
jgi:hypothetical protein